MNRVEKLRGFLRKSNANGIIITSYPNIFYFSDFTSEDAIVYITLDKKYLITDSRYILQSKKEAKGFEVIIRSSSYASELKKLGLRGNVLFEDNIVYSNYNDFSNNLECNLNSTNIDFLRNVKDEEEINKMRKACDIASKTYAHILKFVKAGMSEIEVSNEIVSYMKKLGASKESFDTIVASGKRGALPHGSASNKIIHQGDFVTIDYGCVYKGYCSDITRSFLVGKENKKMEEVYRVVKKAQELAIGGVKAGVKVSEIDKLARDYIASKGYGEYFVHSTGHGLGIVVHDPISVSSKSDMILEENMVITIEPGIYIPNVGGIRIEDDVLVKKDGFEVLTSACKRLRKVTNRYV